MVLGKKKTHTMEAPLRTVVYKHCENISRQCSFCSSSLTLISIHCMSVRSIALGCRTGKALKWLGKHSRDPKTETASARGACCNTKQHTCTFLPNSSNKAVHSKWGIKLALQACTLLQQQVAPSTPPPAYLLGHTAFSTGQLPTATL